MPISVNRKQIHQTDIVQFDSAETEHCWYSNQYNVLRPFAKKNKKQKQKRTISIQDLYAVIGTEKPLQTQLHHCDSKWIYRDHMA